MVSMPIIVLFFKSYDLTLTEVMLLQSIYSLSLALFEIPSGYIADVFGRKKSIVVGTILSFIGYLFFSFFDGFYTFAIAQALVGIAGSLISGSDSALIYDTLLETGNENTYTKIEGKNYAIGNFSEATAGIIGGFLAVSSIYLPVYIQTTILFLSIPIAVTLVEPKRNIKNKLNQSFKAILEVVQFAIVDNIKIRWLIIYSSAMGLATLSTAWLAQPFFKEVGVPLVYFGILWAGLNIATGLTSINAHQFDKKGNTHKVLILLSLAIITLFVTLGMNITIYGLIIIMFIYLLRGIATPMLRNAININTTSDRRATVLSIRSFIIRISFAICAPILGYLADNYSLSISFYLLAMIVGLFSILASYKLIKLY